MEAEPRTGRWLPSLTAILFAILAVSVSLGLPRRLLNSDGDTARHLAHGRWMIEHGQLITADPFSYTKPGEPFTGFEYGSQLLYASADSIGGLPAVAIVSALLIAASYTLLLRFLLRRGADPLLAVLAMMSSVLTGAMFWLARPHLVTSLATVILLIMLVPARRVRLLWFVPLFALWANFHGGFLYGLVLIGLFAAGSLGESVLRPATRNTELAAFRYYAVAFLVSFGATFLTPHGLKLYTHLGDYFRDVYILHNTAEFTSPDFHKFEPRLFLTIVLCWLTATLLVGRRLHGTTLFVLIAGIWFALGAQRNMPLFGLTAIPLLALHLDASWRRIPKLTWLRTTFANGAAIGTTALWVSLTITALGALAISHGRIGNAQVMPIRFDAVEFPVAAFDSLKSSGVKGTLFTEFTWGGYTLYDWPGQRVFMDGGTDFYGGELMRRYGALKAARPGWREELDRWGIDLVVLKPETPLAARLLQDPSWRTWYCDDIAVVLVPALRTDNERPTSAQGCSHAAPEG